MNALEMLRLHMELECITVDAAGDLTRLPCPDPDDIHRLYIAQHADGYSRYFRDDVPDELRARLRELSVETLFTDHEQVKAIFADFGAPCSGMHVGKSYVYPEDFEPVTDTQITESDRDLCRLLLDGEPAVAGCGSIRFNQHSAEAYVFTNENFRQRGYGKRVTRAWAQRVRQSGRIPFYSHLMNNIASQRLAESLGFVWYIDDVGYE